MNKKIKEILLKAMTSNDLFMEDFMEDSFKLQSLIEMFKIKYGLNIDINIKKAKLKKGCGFGGIVSEMIDLQKMVNKINN